MKTDHLRALTHLCRQFGGRLCLVTQHEFDILFEGERGLSSGHDDHGLQEAPFADAHGLHWREKTVYAVSGRERIGPIIHEMGHVFAAPHHPSHACPQCHEWNWLGWEIAVACQIRAMPTWSRDNANYVTDPGGVPWSELSTPQRRAVVSKRLAIARERGLVGTDDEPRSLR